LRWMRAKIQRLSPETQGLMRQIATRMGRDWTGREVGGGLDSAGPMGAAGEHEARAATGPEQEAAPRGDEEGLGAAASGTPHPLEATTPIVVNEAARLMLANPNHPVTKAFSDYIN